MHGLSIRKLADFESLHAVEKGSGRVAVIGIVIRHEAGFTRSVPFLATGHAGMATHANVEINHQR